MLIGVEYRIHNNNLHCTYGPAILNFQWEFKDTENIYYNHYTNMDNDTNFLYSFTAHYYIENNLIGSVQIPVDYLPVYCVTDESILTYMSKGNKIDAFVQEVKEYHIKYRNIKIDSLLGEYLCM